jgi:hypothetical protein
MQFHPPLGDRALIWCANDGKREKAHPELDKKYNLSNCLKPSRIIRKKIGVPARFFVKLDV